MNPWPRRGCGVAAVLALSTALGALPAARPQDQKLPVAEEVLDKAIDALGGKTAMLKHHSRVSKGSFAVPVAGQKGTVTSYEVEPDKYYQAIELVGGMKVESGTDGQVYWVLGPQGARLLEGEDKAMKARDSRFNALLYWRSLYKTAECTGVEDVDEHPCFKVVMTPELGSVQTFYYDCQSCLARRMDLAVKAPQGLARIEVRFEDYKKVDGVLIPHKIAQKMLGIEQIVNLDTVECNVDVPADRFALPEPVKAVVEKLKTTTQPAAPAAGKP